MLADGLSSTYLLVGPPGTGKTTFAVRLADQLKQRVLRVDASGFTASGVRGLSFILDGLKPDMVIVDDIDRAPELAATMASLLTALSDLRAKHPKLTVILTANDESKLDEALLRPGRVDEIVDFAAPTPAERRALFLGYSKQFHNLPLQHADLIERVASRIVDATEGMGAAHLRHFARQLSYAPIEEVLAQIARRQKLKGSGTQLASKAPDTKPAAPN